MFIFISIICFGVMGKKEGEESSVGSMAAVLILSFPHLASSFTPANIDNICKFQREALPNPNHYLSISFGSGD